MNRWQAEFVNQKIVHTVGLNHKTTMGPVYKDTKKIVFGTFQSWGSDMPHDAYVSVKPPRNERVSWLYVVLKGKIGVIT